MITPGGQFPPSRGPDQAERADLLHPDPRNAMINLLVVTHFLADSPDLHHRFGRWLAGAGGMIPPDVFIAAWLAASHDTIEPECPMRLNRPDEALATATDWTRAPGGWG